MSDLSDRFKEEFALLKDHPGVTLELGAVEAWCLLAQVQLACRHPQNSGMCRDIAEHVARQIQVAVATTPALATLAERGWDLAYDEA